MTVRTSTSVFTFAIDAEFATYMVGVAGHEMDKPFPQEVNLVQIARYLNEVLDMEKVEEVSNNLYPLAEVLYRTLLAWDFPIHRPANPAPLNRSWVYPVH